MKTEIDYGTSGAASIRKATIETLEDYDLANRRIEVLRAAKRDSNLECELAALCDAVRSWDKTHDFVTRW